MEKYKCSMCGYVYDPQIGDLVNGVHSGTRFDSLPGTWRCPICGAKKADFEPRPSD